MKAGYVMRRKKFKTLEHISIIELVTELPNAVILVFLSFMSGSLMLALDALESFSNTVQSSITLVLSKKLQQNDLFKYDYGMGKIEAFGGVLSAAFLFTGLLFVLIIVIRQFVNPSAPGDFLFWAIFFKLINISIDIWLIAKQRKAMKSLDSSLMRSNLTLTVKALVFDLVSFVTVSVAYLFRDVSFIVYVEPVICLICIGFLTRSGIKIIKETMFDLLDKTLGEAEQMKILKCMSQIFEGIKGFNGVKTRRSGNRVYIDLNVMYDGDKTYDEIYRDMETFDEAVKKVIPNSITAISICKPDTER